MTRARGAVLSLVLLVSLICSLASPGLAGREARQQPAPGTARIAGRITAADSAKPLRALVQLVSLGAPAPARYVRADAQGRFEIGDLTAGRYRLSARLEGYVSLEFGQRMPPEPGQPIELGTADRFDKADIALPRASAIEGRLVDEFGDPAPGVEVQVARIEYVAGRRRLLPVSTPRRTRPSDDRGQFRIHGLPPGDYHVMALSGPFTVDNNRAGFAATFYPGTTSPLEARSVHLDVGGDALGLSFALSPAPAGTVSGTLLDPSGQPSRGNGVMLIQTTGGDVRLIAPANAATGSDGSFTFKNVPFGTYVLQASGSTGFGALPITVDRPEMTGLTVAMSARVAIRGRIVFEGDGPPPVGRVRVVSRPVDFVTGPLGGGPPLSRVNADWTFEVRGVAGTGVIGIDPAPPWGLKTVTWNGVDVTDTPLPFRERDLEGVEIVLTTRLASVGGAVFDRDQPTGEGTVVVFAEEAAKWTFPSRFVASARPNQQGRFSIAGLPPGSYLVAAVPNVQGTQWQDPEFLEPLRARAIHIKLVESQSATLDLKLLLR